MFNRVTAKVLLLLGALAYLAIVALSLKHFSIWTQILDLKGENAVSLLSQGNAHSLRFLVMLPVLGLALKTGIPADTIFSYEVWFLLIVIGVSLGKTVTLILGANPRNWPIYALVPQACFYVLSFAMNGRIVLAMAGISIILLAQTRWIAGLRRNPFGSALVQMFGLLLMSVSSGTFTVGLCLILTFVLMKPLSRYPLILKREVTFMLVGIACALTTVPIMIIFIDKNIEFFGGGVDGFVNMLQHGAGQVFLSAAEDLVIPLACLFCIMPFALIQFYKKLLASYRVNQLSPPAKAGMLYAVLFGFFGFSTMTVGIPPLVAYWAAWLYQKGRLPQASTAS